MGGVDLNLDSFDLSIINRVPLEVSKGNQGSEHLSLDNCVSLGNTFWSSINGSCQAFQDEDWQLLCDIFNPLLSDRRAEGDRFVPPDAAHSNVSKLRSLIGNEEWVRLQRKEFFCSKKFMMENPGPLFPSSWTSSFKVALAGNETP